MEIALIIVGGITLISIVAVVGDYLTKVKLAQSSRPPQDVQEFERRIGELERRAADQDAKILLLEDNLAFTTKLLEGKR